MSRGGAAHNAIDMRTNSSKQLSRTDEQLQMRWPLVRSGFRGRKRWSVRKPFVFGGLGGDRGGGCENRGAVLCGQGDAPKAIDVEIQQGHSRRNLEQLAAAFFVSVTPTCTQLSYTPNNKIQAVSICRSTPHCGQIRGQDDFWMEGRRTEGKVVAAGTPDRLHGSQYFHRERR